MPSVELRNVSNDYILCDVNLRVEDGEFFTLLGPTGSGKTTLLNVIAGLTPYRGTVLFNGKPVDHLPAELRRVGYVPQNSVLFPHLDVKANVGYSLKVRGLSREEVDEKVRELLKLTGISHLESRYPKDLSCGERQRVALARALAANPKVLLLDEPLSNLDPKTSYHLRIELKRLQRSLNLTTIFVTHDLSEAEEMGGRVGILYKGRLLQSSTLPEILFSPSCEEVFEFTGRLNIFNCQSYRPLGGVAEVDCDGILLTVPYEGRPIRKVAVNSKDIFLSAEEIPGPNVNLFRGEIVDYKVNGSTVSVKVRLGGSLEVFSEMPREAFEGQSLSKGKKVFVKIKLKAIKVST
ncbi:MAG: hypothetical protein DRO52_02720 [Candidatus Hecatellales archaeon]|nr:MAG: hypothetical protein DRO52_02720 [Candidatus Hecatellales archaeon]